MESKGRTIEFEVEAEAEGGYNAYARVGTHSLVTQGETLDELKLMIEDLLRLYTENSGEAVDSYAMLLHPAPVAA